MNAKMLTLYQAVLFIEESDLDTMNEHEYESFEAFLSCCTRRHRELNNRIKAADASKERAAH